MLYYSSFLFLLVSLYANQTWMSPMFSLLSAVSILYYAKLGAPSYPLHEYIQLIESAGRNSVIHGVFIDGLMWTIQQEDYILSHHPLYFYLFWCFTGITLSTAWNMRYRAEHGLLMTQHYTCTIAALCLTKLKWKNHTI